MHVGLYNVCFRITFGMKETPWLHARTHKYVGLHAFVLANLCLSDWVLCVCVFVCLCLSEGVGGYRESKRERQRGRGCVIHDNYPIGF